MVYKGCSVCAVQPFFCRSDFLVRQLYFWRLFHPFSVLARQLPFSLQLFLLIDILQKCIGYFSLIL